MPRTFTTLSIMGRRWFRRTPGLVLLLLPLVPHQVVSGQPQPEYITKLDGSQLAVAELNRLVAEAMAEARVTGLQLAVFNDAQPAFVSSYGYRFAGRR